MGVSVLSEGGERLKEISPFRRESDLEGYHYRGAFSGVFGYSCNGTIENVNKTEIYICVFLYLAQMRTHSIQPILLSI